MTKAFIIKSTGCVPKMNAVEGGKVCSGQNFNQIVGKTGIPAGKMKIPLHLFHNLPQRITRLYCGQKSE
jgi:hypothetical protein